MNTSQAELNYYRIEKAIQYLESHFLEQPDLNQLAAAINISPFHFQRLFTEFAGISPKRFLQYLTTDYLKGKIYETQNLLTAADHAGLSSQSRVYDLFVSLEAVTPQEYKTKGHGLEIEFGYHATPFGLCLIGITDRGVCWLSFLSEGENEGVYYSNLANHWQYSNLVPNHDSTGAIVKRIFQQGEGNQKLNLMVKGTNFQVKVWEALLNLKQGELVTYQYIANQIGSPRALQAVGSAVGSNSLAYLIPCHRVIRKEGKLGEYRWGSARKKMLIGYELAKVEEKLQNT